MQVVNWTFVSCFLSSSIFGSKFLKISIIFTPLKTLKRGIFYFPLLLYSFLPLSLETHKHSVKAHKTFTLFKKVFFFSWSGTPPQSPQIKRNNRSLVRYFRGELHSLSCFLTPGFTFSPCLCEFWKGNQMNILLFYPH